MRLSYRYKLLLILLAIVVLLVAATYFSTRTVIRDAVTQQAYRELRRGGELFSQLIDDRAGQLAQSVSVLTDDFGFKEAVATGDRATIVSALDNHRARVSADIALVVNTAGELVASSVPLADNSYLILYQILSTGRSGTEAHYAPVVLNHRLYQFVFAPVRAPLLIAVAGVGFEIDQSLSEHFKRLTDLEVSFLNADTSGLYYLSGTLMPDEHGTLLSDSHWLNNQGGEVWLEDNKLSNSVSIAEEPQHIVAVLQVPIARAMQPFSALDTQLVSLALSFLLISGLVALVLARSVTRPIRELALTAQKVAEGEYESKVVIRTNDEFGDLAGAFVAMQHALAEREKKIVYNAEHDSLTGLANRSQVVPRLQKALDVAAETDARLVVAIADIQKFTQINDALNPETGDRVLCEVGARLCAAAGKTAVLRLGSDEFLLLVEGDPEYQIQKLLQAFEHSLVVGTMEIKVDLNIGYALYPDQGQDVSLLLRRANLALNQARLSHEYICGYREGWDEQHLRRLEVLSAYKSALVNNQMEIYLQPKINPLQSASLGAEVLIRWTHPELGFVSPEEFIGVIESAGQISVLTRWVLRAALKTVHDLAGRGIVLNTSVNLSVLDLLEDDLPDYLAALVTQYSINPECLCLEITESAIMREAERSLANLNRLSAQGFKVSIDDYGTGYSSLSQLKKLPVYELKIDKSFVLHLEENADDRQIVKSTIELGHTLGLMVTAEGVETLEASEWLIENGCDILQGYYYSKPLPVEKFATWAKNYLAENRYV